MTRSKGIIALTEKGLDDVIDYTDRVSKVSFKTTGRLEGVLSSAFAETQALVHILTASLKLSGKTSTSFDGKVWEGQISYGGKSPGVNDPVDYAVYEMARGDVHDWFRTLPSFYDQFEAAVLAHFE